MELHIDEEFQSIWGPLTDSEFRTLEKQIKRDGLLSPIIVWNGVIVDGHNRYMICKMNGITDFPIKEINFKDRLDVIEWIMDNQNGRRNTTDFQRVEVALRYEPQIAERAKERMSEGGKGVMLKGGPAGPTLQNDTHFTRREIAKISKTSSTTVARAKRILSDGTEEQIDRARKGGTEPDGRSNSISAIAEEIKMSKEVKKNVNETMICSDCGKEKPLSEFPSNGSGGYRKYCYECRKIRRIGGDTAQKYIDDLHDYTKEIEYTVSDFEEEVRENMTPSISVLESALDQHKDMLDNAECRSRIRAVLNDVANEIKRIMEERCYE